MGVWGHTQSSKATFLTVEGHPPEHGYRCNKAGHQIMWLCPQCGNGWIFGEYPNAEQMKGQIRSSGAKSIANITAQPPNGSHVGYLPWILLLSPIAAQQPSCILLQISIDVVDIPNFPKSCSAVPPLTWEKTLSQQIQQYLISAQHFKMAHRKTNFEVPSVLSSYFSNCVYSHGFTIRNCIFWYPFWKTQRWSQIQNLISAVGYVTCDSQSFCGYTWLLVHSQFALAKLHLSLG